MLTFEDVEELKAKRICSDCIGETFLKDEVLAAGDEGECTYCAGVGPTITIGDLADRVSAAFGAHYVRTSDQMDSFEQAMAADRESSFEWERHGEPVVDAIANAAMIELEPAQDVQAILADDNDDISAQEVGEETDFADDSYYEPRDVSDAEWQIEWDQFEISIKTEARFFSRTSAALLRSVFAGIEEMSTETGEPLVVEAGPGTAFPSLYRAREFQRSDVLIEALGHPDKTLGPPPTRASAGRMNPEGISVFYGATHQDAALAEVRPPVGSRVAVALFEVIRPLRLLDLSALVSVTGDGSIFDPSYSDRMERAMFLRSLCERMVRPVMPDDRTSDYLPTQAVADFLATEREPALDGILYPSVQSKSGIFNVVLFHKAALVEELVISQGTTFRAYADDIHADFGGGYQVQEIEPKRMRPKPRTKRMDRSGPTSVG